MVWRRIGLGAGARTLWVPLLIAAFCGGAARADYVDDPRTARAVRFTSPRVPLGECLRVISEAAEVRLTAAPGLAEEDLVASVPRRPLRETMRALEEIYDAAWTSPPGESPSYHLVPIGGTVWYDANGNGLLEMVESGFSGVRVRLDGPNGLLRTTFTDPAGDYDFQDLPPGTYTVTVDTTTLPSGLVPTWDFDGIHTAHRASVTLQPGVAVSGISFGYNYHDTRKFATYTQGGWSSSPQGNNPGTLLQRNFGAVYPSGINIGGIHRLRFVSSAAVRYFLPQGGTPAPLARSYLNPVGPTEAGVLAGQVLALQLNVDFSNAGVTRRGLAFLSVASGPFAGWAVMQVQALGLRVLGGEPNLLPAGVSISALNDTITRINENFVDGKNNHYLR